MSSFDVSKERPWIAPLKSGFQCGAPSPVKDGIMTTSEFLFADFANFSVSGALEKNFILSLNH